MRLPWSSPAASLFKVRTSVPTHTQRTRRWWGYTCLIVGCAGTAYISINHISTWSNISNGSLSALVWCIRAMLVAIIGVWVAHRLPWRSVDFHTQWQGFVLNAICALLLIPAVVPIVFEPKPWDAFAYYTTTTFMLCQIINLSQHGLVRTGAALLTGNLILQAIGLAALDTNLAHASTPLIYCLIILVAGLLVHWWFALVIVFAIPIFLALLGSFGMIPTVLSRLDVVMHILILSAESGIVALYTWSLDQAHQQYYSLVHAHAHLAAYAKRDPLTGLFHRGALADLAAQSSAEHHTVGTLIIDIDHFKAVNDTYGHFGGDQVLREVAETLQKALRSNDWACRYGGEEFVMLLPAISGPALAERAQALCERVRQLRITYQKHTIRVTISVGVAHYPTHGATVLETLEMADVALYQAKRSGRNRVVAFTEVMQ